MRLRLPFLVLIVLSLGTGCSTGKLVHFDSHPQGVHIDLNGNYLGDTPFSRQVTGKYNRWMIITAERRGYKTKKKEIVWNEIPDKMFFTLATIEEHRALKGGGEQQQMQQQMQGPTIVIPGSSGQPVQISPGKTK